MTTEQLQFVFSLFSFVGVVGILFYIIVEKTKIDERNAKIARLEEALSNVQEHLFQTESEPAEVKEEVPVESVKEKIIALYEEGADVMLIESALNVPKAKVEMVLKFHNLNKADNWRDSVENNL